MSSKHSFKFILVALLILCNHKCAQQGVWVKKSLAEPIGSLPWHRAVGGNCCLFLLEESPHLYAYDNISGQWHECTIPTKLSWKKVIAGDSVAMAWNDSLLVGYSALSHNFVPHTFTGTLVGGVTGYVASNRVTCFLTTDSCYVFDAEDSQWHLYKYSPPASGDSMFVIIHPEKDYLLLALANRYGWVEKSIVVYSHHRKAFWQYSGDNLQFELLVGGVVFYIDVGNEENQFFGAWSAYTGEHPLVQQSSFYPIFVNETNRGTTFMFAYNDMSDYPYIVRYMYGYDTRKGSFVVNSFGYDGEHRTSADWVLGKNSAVQCARDLDAGDLMEYYIYYGDVHDFIYLHPTSPGIGYGSLCASNREPALGNNILMASGCNNIMGYDLQTGASAFTTLPTPTAGYQNPVSYWSASNSIHAHCKRALTKKFYIYTYNTVQNDTITVQLENVPDELGYGYTTRFEQEEVFGFLLQDSSQAYILLSYSPPANIWTRRILGDKPKIYGSQRDYIFWSDPANNIMLLNGPMNSEVQIAFGYDPYTYSQYYIPRDNYFLSYTASNQYVTYSSHTNTLNYHVSERFGLVQPKQEVVLFESSESKEYLAYSALDNTFTSLGLTDEDGIGIIPMAGDNTALVMTNNGYLYAFNPYGTATALDDNITTNLHIPDRYQLFQNYPNPFNPATMISYQLPMTSKVELSIYNLLGQRVATLVSQKQPAGTYSVQWDASGFASGVYLYRLEAGDPSQGAPKGHVPTGQAGYGFVKTRKMVLMK
jgi:hypothetical protein